MSLPTMRHALEAIMHQAQEGDLDGVIQTARQTMRSLEEDQLLTTREAAQLLGIRSINTLKGLVIRNGIPYQRVGNRMMLLLSEVERLSESPVMRGLRASEAAHDILSELGSAEGMTAEEMQDLEATRPGRLPWQTEALQPLSQDEESTLDGR